MQKNKFYKVRPNLAIPKNVWNRDECKKTNLTVRKVCRNKDYEQNKKMYKMIKPGKICAE